jgi:IS1 family transposase/transposase-like protein
MSLEIRIEHALIVVLLSIVLKNLLVQYHAHGEKWKKKCKKGPPRAWKPRSPKKCPACRAGVCLPALHPRREVTPWQEVRSRRGRKKGIDTEGHCCLNPFCAYFWVTDAAVHALVGNGVQGPHKIQLLRCQACGRGFSSRRNTPLYYLKTAVERIEMCLWLLAEGVDIAVLVRFTHHVDATLSRWLERAGRHSEKLHQQLFVDLELAYVQIDELKAPIVGDKENWLWAAIEPLTKIVPAIHVGKRSNDDAMIFIHHLALSLAPGCVPAFTSDGLRQYFYALTAHFGHWRWPNSLRGWVVSHQLLYGQLVKQRGKKADGKSFTTIRMKIGRLKDLVDHLRSLDLTGTIQTALIERFNLTARHGVAPLSRRTWSKARSVEALYLHVQWWRMYYHFSREHVSLRVRVPGLRRRYRARSPAMAAGLTDHLWSVGDVLHLPVVVLEGGIA